MRSAKPKKKLQQKKREKGLAHLQNHNEGKQSITSKPNYQTTFLPNQHLASMSFISGRHLTMAGERTHPGCLVATLLDAL